MKKSLIILENLAKKAVEASNAVLDLMDDPTNKDKIARISEIETEADILTRDIFSELNKTFILRLTEKTCNEWHQRLMILLISWMESVQDLPAIKLLKHHHIQNKWQKN